MIAILCYFAFGITFAVARVEPFFRRDYRYMENFDAFYKLHWDESGKSWDVAYLACEDEGASLFYPKLTEEYKVVNIIMQNMREKPNTTEVFVGFHDEFGIGEYITVDGNPTPLPIVENTNESIMKNRCIIMNSENGLFSFDDCETTTTRPFLCKREIKQNPCGTIDEEYKYKPETQKCYKFSKQTKTWNEAKQTCYMEGGSLLIIKDSNEYNLLTNMKYEADRTNQFYHVGFQRSFNDHFYTVKGNNFLNNFYRPECFEENGDCGRIQFDRNNGCNLKSSDCYASRPYICEIVIDNV